MHSYSLGRLAGLQLSTRPSAFVGLLGLWIVLSGVAVFALDLSLPTAIAGALVATSLHVGSVILHHVGHAWVARRTGHPMTGIQLWGLVGMSVYPADEPALAPSIHIQRALGGPFASLLVALVAGGLTLLLGSGVAYWISLFCFLDNLFVLTLQVFLPFGFNDGSAILHWWNVQRKQAR